MEPLSLKQPGAEWGPRLWLIFHTMAEWSDRRDIVYRWKHMMELAAVTIPCEVCRRHMQDYLRSHSIFVRSPDPPSPPVYVRKFRGVVPPKVKGWTPTKGEEVKTAIQKGMIKFHNHVTRSKGGTDMPEEEALKLYESTDRSIACKAVREQIAFIDSLWKPHARISYKEWMIELLALLALIESGSY